MSILGFSLGAPDFWKLPFSCWFFLEILLCWFLGSYCIVSPTPQSRYLFFPGVTEQPSTLKICHGLLNSGGVSVAMSSQGRGMSVCMVIAGYRNHNKPKQKLQSESLVALGGWEGPCFYGTGLNESQCYGFIILHSCHASGDKWSHDILK